MSLHRERQRREREGGGERKQRERERENETQGTMICCTARVHISSVDGAREDFNGGG